MCWLYQCEPLHMNQKLYFYFSYPRLVLLPLLLMFWKKHTLCPWMLTCSVSLLLSLVVTLWSDFFISLMVFCGMLLLHTHWLYILNVQLFQHAHFFICAVNQVLREFIMLWCWTPCLCGSPLSWNILCHISLSSIALMNDLVSFDVSEFTKEKLILPVLMRRNIKPFS